MPVAVALLIAAPRVLREGRAGAAGVRRSFDFAGAVTLTAGMLLLVRTSSRRPTRAGARRHDRRAGRRGAAAGGVRRASSGAARNPLVRLGILRSAPLLRANLGMMTMFGAYIGFQFVGTLYLQSVLGWSPVETALAFLPGRR